MLSRVAVPLAVCATAVFSALALGHGASAREVAPTSRAASTDGVIAYTVVRSAEQLFETPVASGSARRLRTNDAVEYEPSVSPNGRRLVFVSSLGGSADIYVASRNGSGQKRLTTSPLPDWDPAWSPAGTRIAWVRVRDGRGELWVMAADGSGQRWIVAAKDAQNPSWSPDGKRLVFWDARNEVVYTVSSAGGVATRVTTGRHPDWSPDGGSIALARDVDETSTLFVYDVASRTDRRLIPDSEADDSWPVWSPDGKRIAFERYDWDTDSTDIGIVGADGKGDRPVLATPDDDYNPQFTPDGMHLTFSSDRASNADIAVANADGTNERVIVSSAAWDYDPSWSPDGTALVFTSDRSTGLPVLSRTDGPTPAQVSAEPGREIYRVQADGTGLRRLTKSPADDVSAAWGPGNRIAFESDRSGDPEIWTVEADGTDPKQVTRHDGWDGDPDWSPDGTRIAYASERGDDTEIFVTSVDGKDTVQITRNDADDDGPAWSPDGRLIAFESEVRGPWDVWVAESDGNGVRRVTRTPGYDEYPDWASDGKWIVFSRETDDGLMRIMRVRPNGSGIVQVTTGQIRSWLPSTFAPAP
jgi:TolB protein